MPALPEISLDMGDCQYDPVTPIQDEPVEEHQDSQGDLLQAAELIAIPSFDNILMVVMSTLHQKHVVQPSNAKISVL